MLIFDYFSIGIYYGFIFLGFSSVVFFGYLFVRLVLNIRKNIASLKASKAKDVE